MYKVAIRKNKTNEVRIYEDSGEWIDGMEWQWTEGNYGCDCNLSLFFEQAIGKELEKSDNCGDDKYSIDYIELLNGIRFKI